MLNYGTDECCGGLVKGKDRWEYTSPVGSFQPNQFDLYDTAGNVWEWTCSEYEKKYDGKEKRCLDNVKGYFVLRGGSWNYVTWVTRSANRGQWWPINHGWGNGFRLVRL